MANIFASTETTVSTLTGSNISKNATISIEDQWFSYMKSHPTTWKNSFGVKQINDLVVLRFDDSKKEYFNDEWTTTVTYNLVLTYADFTTDTLKNQQLTVNYSNPPNTYQDIAIGRFMGAHKVELTVTAVGDTMLPDISLDVQINIERCYAFDSNINFEVQGDSIANNEFKISWDYLRGAEFYEVEYLFVDMLENPSSTHKAFDFDNATRITTTNTFYSLNLAYPKGALIYRIRGVGFSGNNFSFRKETNWSYTPAYGKGFTNEVPAANLFSFGGLVDSLNWQYTVNYAEEGKRKELLSFADGSLHNRLSVTLANTDTNAIVSAPVYDYQGRASVQVLPVPVTSNGLQYYKSSNTLDINGGFNRNNFDTDTKVNNPDSLPSLSVAGIYYSPSNPNKIGAMAYIPDADGYAYSRTVFKNDGTDRIIKQCGLDEIFKSGSGHETKYYYGAPSGQIELDRLFGSEVGWVEHYKKNLVQDANGQISVSYIDQHGRTIATALAGDAPSNLITIDGKPDADTLTANLLNPNDKVGDYEMRSSKVITVSSPSDFHFVYNLKDTMFCDADTCLPCQDCLYDLVITVSDADLNILYNSTIANNNQIITINSTSNNYYEFMLPASIMQIGTYTITKSLKLNQVNILKLDSIFNANQLCVPYDSIDPAPCNISCESLCAQNYTRTDADGNTYYVDDNNNVFYNIADVQNLIDSCVLQTCENHFEGGIDLCSVIKTEMLTDVSKGGQYFDNTPDQYILQNGNLITNPSYNQDEWLNTQSIPSLMYVQYKNWDDIRDHWQDAWAQYMLPLHPEYCDYQYFCEFNPTLNCLNDTAFANYRDYDQFINGINDDVIASSSPYYLFNPIAYSGTSISNGPSKDNSNYINYPSPTATYQDPFFVCNPSARDSMIYHLTHFIEISPNTGKYYSIWYVIDDPDNIALSNNITGLDTSIQKFIKSISWQNGLLGSGLISRFQFFKSIYTYFKQSIVAQQYPAWHDQHCDNTNDVYYLTDVGNGLDANGYQIRWPKNDILNFTLASIDSLFNSSLDQFNDQCTQSCELHADNWMQEIAGCYSQKDSAAIRNLLIEVCAAACNMSATPNGSSVITNPDNYVTTIINGKSYTFTSFTDVLEFYGSSCPLITYPEVYDQGKCSCETYESYLSTEKLNDYDYSAIAAILVNLTGINFSTADIATWRTVCSSASPSITSLTNANFPNVFWCDESTTPDDNVDSLMAAVQKQCEDQALLAAIYESDKEYQENVQTAKTNYLKNYADACFTNIKNRESFDVTYTLNEYLYTLYYYDQAGNLVKTIPPKGVQIIKDADSLTMIDNYKRNDSTQRFLPAHKLITNYVYNSLNQLQKQNSPDGGTSYFWYDEVGRLCASQNAKQRNQNAYSYTVYDNFSRITEGGEITNVTDWDTTTSFITQANYTTWLATSGAIKTEISHSYYDGAVFTISNFTQENLRGRIASITYDEDGNGSYEFASHYSYDQHGNVKSLIQQNVKLSTVEASQQYKKLDYEYDLLNGNVKAVHYQTGKLDEFNHYYQYDADNRLTHVYTSESPLLFTNANAFSNFKLGTLNAKLFYYPHGPLMREELGDKQVQGTDYAYTLQGWLKTINGSTLNSSRDMGADGGTNNQQLTTNNYFAQDALGFSLQYYSNDYVPNNQQLLTNNYCLTTNNDQLTTNLYNGNISQMVMHYLDYNESPVQVQAETYNYDQLNRIKTSNVYTATDMWGHDEIANNNSLTTATNHNDYRTAYTYDFNGNINSLIRHGSASNIIMDSLNYHYSYDNNQLSYVAENTNTAYSNNYTTDIDAGQKNSNYHYDEIGNLSHDEQEEIDTIIWNIQGKIREIRRKNTSSKSDLEFFYDALGNRIGKLVKPRNKGQLVNEEFWTYTWYVLDASGNVMATYRQNYVMGMETVFDIDSEMALDELTILDYIIYGNKKLGTYEKNKTMAGIGYVDFSFNTDGTINLQNAAVVNPDILTDYFYKLDTAHYVNVLGRKRFELTDHLGNVRAVISDRKMGINTLTIADENFNQYIVSWLPYTTNSMYTITSGGQNGELNVTTKGYSYGVRKKYTLPINHKFKVEFDFDLVKGKKVKALCTNKTGTNSLGSTTDLTSDGHYSYTFTSTTDTTIIYFLNLSQNGTNCEFYIDNFKLMQTDTFGYYKPDVISSTDYYPFGSEKPGRSFASGFYQYSVNGQEKIDEISGEGNHNTAQFWEYDTRLGRRWNLDPKPVTSISSYSAFMNNPIVFSDVFGDTSQYYNMKTNELLGTINNSGSLMRYKVDASDYNFYTGDVYSGKDLSNQTNANSFVTGLNAFSQANETTLGGNRFAAETGIEMKFSGNSAQSNTIINQASINNGNAKPIYSNGTLTTNALFDDGSKIQLQTLSARSGPWGNSSLPNGTYSASSIVNTAESGMLRNGVGFKVILSNNTAYSRTSLRIHPDQEPQPGSSGCIGLVAGANDLNQFRKIVRNYFSSHNNTSFNVIVNINGNPNYSGNGSANLLGE